MSLAERHTTTASDVDAIRGVTESIAASAYRKDAAAMARHYAPAGGIATMQTINVVVLNPWFFATFFGTAAVSLVLAVGAAVQWPQPGSAYLLAGSALYFIGGIVVTRFVASR